MIFSTSKLHPWFSAGILLPACLTATPVINEFMAANDTIVVPDAEAGTFDDWIELRNPEGTAQDLSGWFLTDDPGDLQAWSFPEGTIIPANGFLVVIANGDGVPNSNGALCTNFRLSGGGEYVALVQPDLGIASEFGPGGADYPLQSPDVSYGIHPTNGQTVFFETPTPGAANDPAGVARVSALTVTPQRGLYQTAQTISLATSTPGATIYYTTDGTPPLNGTGNPTATATAYSSPFTINQTTVVRSAATAAGQSPSLEQAHTYLLLDIDNANPDGTDTAGLNTPFLEQTRPSGYGNLASGDYNMDTRVTRSTALSAGHGGLTIAQAMLEGIREAPTISISMPPADFVTLYANPTSQGLERACSAEFIPGANDSRTAFQELCGLRVQGGASRNPSNSPKHSLSFRFREEYGSGRLREVLFPEVDVANFNSIALRAGYNNSWIHWSAGQRPRGSMIRDQWMRESLFDMGNEDAGSGFLAHLFVNGLYWGLHNICERQDDAHYANYNGGDSDLIDARNGATFVGGNSAAWNAMRSTVSARNWEDIQQVIDVDSYIDFQLIQRFGGNKDLKVDGNWRAAGGGPFSDPTDMRPWKLYSWDGERVLESPSETQVPLDPMNIRGSLESMPEYRQRFADRAYMHLTGDGALTPEKCRARWEKHASAIDKAIIAESARWGDHRQSTPFDRDDWLTEQNRLYNTYFTVRTNNVINNLRNAGLFPALDPPAFSVNGQPSSGGFVGGGNSLSIDGEDGTIYYTTDGSDPRLPDGSINPNALSLTSGGVPESIFAFESTGWRYLTNGVAQSDSNVVVGNPSYNSGDWKHPDFNDASWNSGQALLAGSNANSISGRTANTVFSLSSPNGLISTAYFRKEFEVTDASAASTIDLTLVRDDGVIVYLNGKEIYRNNMPGGTVTYADLASGNANETEILEHSQPLGPGDLIEGTNVLAIELHNSNVANNDMGIDVAVSVSRENLVLPESARLTARAREGSNWSPLVSGVFLVEEPANASNLAISEINYHPRDVTLAEFVDAAPVTVENAEVFEYLELENTGSSPINLFQLSFADGVDFTADLKILNPGEHALIVRDQEAFTTRYGSSQNDKIIGSFTGGLNNDGETLTILDWQGAVISSFTYNDAGSWPSRPDGEGSSLEFADSTGDPNDPNSWQPSVLFDGSPGITGPLSDQRIVINEVSSNSAADYIELHNTTASPIELGGWLLTDTKSVYRSFTIPETTLAANDYLVISASQFNAPTTTPITNYSGSPGGPSIIVTSPGHGLTSGDIITISGYGGVGEYNDSFDVLVFTPDSFAIRFSFVDNHPVKGGWERGRSFGLSANNGDDLWLLEADENGKPIAFVDHVDFAAAAPDTTLGRWPDGMGSGTLITMTTDTGGTPNSGPLLGPVYLTEVHYTPTGNDSHEFVEITNTGSTPVSLDQWRLRGGLDFDFTTDHTIAPGQSIVVVSFDPIAQAALAADFRSTFGITASVLLIGPATDGPLNDDGGTVRLQKAGPGPDFAQITVDEVRYLAEAPWPVADNGNSLNRTASLAFGNFDQSWGAAAPTPGSFIESEDYAAWAAANGVGSGELDDDGDSLVNFLEFALGTDPNQPTALPPANFDGDTGTISFPSHLNRSGFNLILETSSNLSQWAEQSTVPGAIEGPIQNNTWSFSRPENPLLFWRIRAVPTGN